MRYWLQLEISKTVRSKRYYISLRITANRLLSKENYNNLYNHAIQIKTKNPVW